MRNIFGLGTLILLVACGNYRVFEENTDLEGNYWVKDQIISFDFRIEDPQLSYNVYSNIRNAVDYPYHNLYYQYTLEDSSGLVLEEELKNIDLFDPKTGQPFGSGLGDLFDHRQTILEEYEFDDRGTYTLKFQHYMRTDTLPLITSVGARVEWVSEEE